MTSPNRHIRVLVVEDVADDAELVLLELRNGGYEPEWRRVCTAPELSRALLEPWDLVLSDYTMPELSAPMALRLVREVDRDLPFIIVSGSVGEALAVEAMKAGAQDFFLKHQLGRLPSAVERELREAAGRRERVRAEERLRAIFEQTIAGIAQTDSLGKFVMVNDRFCELVGRSREALLKMTMHELTHPLDRDVFNDRFERTVNEGRGFTTDKRFLKGDTDFVWVRSAMSLARDAAQRPLAMVELVQDISDEKRVVEELSRTVRFSEMFIGILSHDLRNPLSAITTAAGMLLRRAEGVERLHVPVTRILNSADRMRRMIDQLLDFTRMRTGQGLSLERQPVDLAELCHRAVDEVLIALDGLDIRLEVHGNGEGSWDKDRLSQLVSNLVANAAQHRQPGTQVVVHLDGTRSERVTLQVRNQGLVPEAVLPVIFEPFRAARSGLADRARGSSGLGLGLYITQQIVLAHGGSIRVESAEGSETRFIVELPRIVESANVQKKAFTSSKGNG